jgi:hypothetical protein
MVGPGKAIDTDALLRGLRQFARQLLRLQQPGIDRIRPPAKRYRLRFPELDRRHRPRGFEAAAFISASSARGRDRPLARRHGGAGLRRPSSPGVARGWSASRAPRLPRPSRSRCARCSARRSCATRNGTAATTPSDAPPRTGMRLARKLGTITYRSADEWRIASAGSASPQAARSRRCASPMRSRPSSRSKAISRRRPRSSCACSTPTAISICRARWIASTSRETTASRCRVLARAGLERALVIGVEIRLPVRDRRTGGLAAALQPPAWPRVRTARQPRGPRRVPGRHRRLRRRRSAASSPAERKASCAIAGSPPSPRLRSAAAPAPA